MTNKVDIKMNKQWIILILALVSQIAIAQQTDEEQQLLVGRIVSKDTSTTVPYAFVANSKTGIGKETSGSGLFTIYTNANDTIYFRCLGYKDTMFVVNEQMLMDTTLLCVQKKEYALESVDVIMFKSYASFKHMIANMDIEPEMHMKMQGGFTMTDLRRAEKERSGTFGLTARFGGSSARRKERKFAAFAANEKRYERFREMTSRENMRYFTKLDSAQLDSFMVFLRSKHQINPNLSDYKMMEAISMVFDQFMALNSDSVN